MKQKYRRNVAEIMSLGEELRAKLCSAEGPSEQEDALRMAIEQSERDLTKTASRLLKERRNAARRLEQDVQKELASLGMKGTRFIVEIKMEEDTSPDIELEGKGVRLGSQGPGEVQFLISPNVGEDPRPLVRIASGGEVSRIMLAMKRVLVRADVVDVMVFDEIDVGIGGKVARVVGEKLKALSRSKQTICITHIPMIACLGDTQFSVSKEVEGGRTHAGARSLKAEERVTEVARMLAGDKVSGVTLKQAREMLGRGPGKARAKRAGSSEAKCARSSVG
jgi:DNA repair protein RecN (Recombination protein N)